MREFEIRNLKLKNKHFKHCGKNNLYISDMPYFACFFIVKVMPNLRTEFSNLVLLNLLYSKTFTTSSQNLLNFIFYFHFG